MLTSEGQLGSGAHRRARRLLWGDAMKMHVYGPGGENSPTVLIIHPMLSSASSMKAALCDHMGSDPRFLVPDLSVCLWVLGRRSAVSSCSSCCGSRTSHSIGCSLRA